MPQNKLVKSALLGLLILNVALVFLFPNKAPDIEQYSLPASPVDAQIKVSFSELMDKTTVASAFQIYPKVPGKISWAGRQFVFTPDENLDFGVKYQVKFAESARSKRGWGLGKEWLKDFETIKMSFLFVDQNGVLKRYFTADGSDKKLSPNGEKVSQYDYESSLKKIVYVNDVEEVYLVDLEGGEPKELKIDEGSGVVGKVKWLPFENSLLVAIVGEEKTALWKYGIDGSDGLLIKESGTLSYDFFPSPDGRQVLFIGEDGSLILHNLNDGQEELVNRDFFEHFGFSEYGGYILYTIMTNQGVFDFSNNLVLHKNNGEKEILFNGKNVRIGAPVISPKEDFLAFEYTKDDSKDYAKRVSQLGIIDLETQELKLVTEVDAGSVKNPQFSPDGKGIIFNSDASLFLYNMNGGIENLKLNGAMVKWVY